MILYLTPLVNSTRIIESSLLTKIQGGTGGVQLISSDTSLLLEASTAEVSSLKPLIAIDTFTCYGTATFNNDIAAVGAILTDTMRSKTNSAITINDNVIINGSLKFTTKIYAEFWASVYSANYTTNETTVPIDSTRYNSGGVFSSC